MLDMLLDLYQALINRPAVIIIAWVAWLAYYLGCAQLAKEIAKDRVAELQRQIEQGYEAEVQRRLQEGTRALEEHARGYDRWVQAVSIGLVRVLCSDDPHEVEQWRREAERVIARRQTPLRLLAQLAIRSGLSVDCPYRVEGT